MRILIFVLSLSLLLPSSASASLVVGCDLDGNEIPTIQFDIYGSQGNWLTSFDSTVDTKLRMPTFLQKALPDGAFYVVYRGADRREAYNSELQELTIRFYDEGPAKLVSPGPAMREFMLNKHADGDVTGIPILGQKDVQHWNGLATLWLHYGRIFDGVEDVCYWFCDLEIEWIVNVANEETSFGRIKALYE
jgi:hypothetical protein